MEAKRRKVDPYPPRGNRFKDKVAIITGAAGNFGAVRETYQVPVKAYTLDVTKDANVEKTVEEIHKEFGCIDCLFNNAGYQGLFAPVDDYSAEDFEKVLKINVTGVFSMLKYVSKVMIPEQTGKQLKHGSEQWQLG
eukprot:g18636.t1